LLRYETSVAFNRDLKRQKKRNKNITKLRAVMRRLITEQPLLARHHNHPLHGGEWEGKWECHVEPDWLLVYRIDEEERRVLFYRTGSHSDLF
jgi:mRNA interferase YafQ